MIRALRDEFLLEESLIPSRKQINNRLNYWRTNKAQHTNDVECVEAELRRFVRVGDEDDFQPFIYLHDVDANGRYVTLV